VPIVGAFGAYELQLGEIARGLITRPSGTRHAVPSPVDCKKEPLMRKSKKTAAKETRSQSERKDVKKKNEKELDGDALRAIVGGCICCRLGYPVATE
jgi:hypothetical protein